MLRMDVASTSVFIPSTVLKAVPVALAYLYGPPPREPRVEVALVGACTIVVSRRAAAVPEKYRDAL